MERRKFIMLAGSAGVAAVSEPLLSFQIRNQEPENYNCNYVYLNIFINRRMIVNCHIHTIHNFMNIII